METLKKPGGIAEKPSKSKEKPVRDLDTQSKDYQGVTWPALATCRRNFHNSKKLETNSEK